MAKTILIVDDDAEDLMLLEETLREEGYAVVTTTDPEDGLRQARALKPDLIILDEVMPKLFGSEVGMRLLADPRTKHIPVMFLTALKTPDDPTPSSPANVVIAKSAGRAEILDAISHYV